MNKVKIRMTLFALITGIFLIVVSGCGYRCEGWAYRTAYRQMCKSYSSNGHCSFWGSESYQERYCTRWIKDPGSKKRSRSKTPPLRLALKAGKAYFPKIPGAPTEGETYLLTQLTPFLCDIMKSDDIIKTLSSMGQCKIRNKNRSALTPSNTTFLQRAIPEITVSLWVIIPLKGYISNK